MKQLDLFQWAEARPTAQVIDLMPAVIRNICSQPFPFPRKEGELVNISTRRRVA